MHAGDPGFRPLWKAAKRRTFLGKPWGKGPPWLAHRMLGHEPTYLPLDIPRAAGRSIFPHHENEIAQSEAACACSVYYWVHNGFVQVNAEKMSKSLGNFKTIRDILENYLPETLRFFLLGKHYRSPIDFTADSMDEAEKAQHRVYTALHEASKALARDKWKKTPLPQEMAEEWAALPKAFDAALEDDINTAQALGQVFAQVRHVNRLLEDKALRAAEAGRDLLQEFLVRAQEWTKRLGLFGQDPLVFLADLRDQRAARRKIDVARVEELMLARQEARASKDFGRSIHCGRKF